MIPRILKQSRLWSIAVAVLIAAQVALALHGVEHKFDLGAPPSDHCALCQVVSTLAPGPAADPIAAPTLHELTRVAAVFAPQPRIFPSPAGFRSRAPPTVVSV
jgi:hypothetical protein